MIRRKDPSLADVIAILSDISTKMELLASNKCQFQPTIVDLSPVLKRIEDLERMVRNTQQAIG